MTGWFEDPTPILVIAVLAEAVLGVIFFSTRRGAALLAMLGVLALAVLGLFIERAVVTPREEVEMAIDQGIEALRSDIRENVYACIASKAEAVRRHADRGMSFVQVTDIGVHNLKVEVNQLTSPPSATAEFDGVIQYRPKLPDIIRDKYPGHFVFKFVLEDNRWRVAEVEGVPMGTSGR